MFLKIPSLKTDRHSTISQSEAQHIYSTDWRILGDLLPRLRTDPGTGLRLIVVVLLLLATAALNAAVPVFYKHLVDHFVLSPAVIPVLLVGAYIAAQS
ncbi:MAG: hypothetical protein ACXVBX_16555, partial [Flavisolibacter sp.]